MALYNSYIELSPSYESVIDIDSEKRNPNLWREYIVHDDMVKAIEKICQSIKFEDPDKRRSFWIHGAYGTGKSYAGIVLKHLFEDSLDKIREFLSRPQLTKYREEFLGIREKGKYLVVWKNQATDIKTSTQLLMAMELAIRERLEEEFGTKAKYGSKSLVCSAQKAVNDSSYNWNNLFEDSSEALYEEYESLEDFREKVNEGDLKACMQVSRIFSKKGWAFLSVIEDFKAWISEVIEENGLSDTGIMFIWDEFTTYIRENPNDDVLQPLSEFCKQQPFFMFLIVHKDSSWIEKLGKASYERIVHRFHDLDFHIGEGAAIDMIANTIRERPNMKNQWEEIKKKLLSTIGKHLTSLIPFKQNGNEKETLKNLCPIHPMTIHLLSLVASNFGASQRTLFRFMKDKTESNEKVGFVYFINHYGYEKNKWIWLTPDFLWDYFFTRESDIRDYSQEAQKAYEHFLSKIDEISNEYCRHIFKAALLLISVGSSHSVSNLYSKSFTSKISATKKVLENCFVGQLTHEEFEDYLNKLVNIGVLNLDLMSNNEERLQIPYSGSGNRFESQKEKVKYENSRYQLFSKNKTFAKAIENKIWDQNKGTYSRIYVAACCSETISIKNRLGEIKSELQKNPFKFGILIVCIEKENEFLTIKEKVESLDKELRVNDRLAVMFLKEPLTDDILDHWYRNIAHAQLANEEGKITDKNHYEDEAEIIVEEWASTTTSGSVAGLWKGVYYTPENGQDVFLLSQKIEKEILLGEIFSCAPEKIVPGVAVTVYKKNKASVALQGVQKKADDKQIASIYDCLKTLGLLELDSIDSIAQLQNNPKTFAIAQLATFIRDRLSQKDIIKLDELWSDLQNPPFGFSNNIVSAYLLGFLLRFYVNSEFTWNKGDNNPWQLTEMNLATMITDLCNDKVTNHYLTPGSEIWSTFKQYVIKIFNLENTQAVNAIEARKFIAKQCIEKVGVPFWTLKYLPENNFDKDDNRSKTIEIIDLLCQFISQEGDHEQLMNDIVTKFKGLGKIRELLRNKYFDKQTVTEAFSVFTIQKNPELSKYQKKIGLTNQDILDGVSRLMQGEIWTWTEDDVASKLEQLCIEYDVVETLNKALRVERKHKTIASLVNEINNIFNNMKIPGLVLEQMEFDWIPSLKALREIASSHSWTSFSIDKQKEIAETLKTQSQTVLDYVGNSEPVLKAYCDRHNYYCNDDELHKIYESLRTFKYDNTPTDFEENLKTHLEAIEYNRNIELINQYWIERSGFNTVDDWCNHWMVPIQWVVSSDAESHIRILHSVQEGKKVLAQHLDAATQFFASCSLEELMDERGIFDAFFKQIGESYRAVFVTDNDILIKRLTSNELLTSNVYNWSTQVGEIHKTLDEFLRQKYFEQAKENVKTMSEKQLRNVVLKVLESNPDLYSFFN